ncbi:MAG: LuxR C-terminal-related transcriptional regulator [Geminicoccaceae bacterium]
MSSQAFEDSKASQAKGKRKRLNWQIGEAMIDEGASNAEIANELGCSASTVAKHRRVRRHVHEVAMNTTALTPTDAPHCLRDTVQHAIEREIDNGNTRIILWLAERLNVLPAANENDGASELRSLMQGLCEGDVSSFRTLGEE